MIDSPDHSKLSKLSKLSDLPPFPSAKVIHARIPLHILIGCVDLIQTQTDKNPSDMANSSILNECLRGFIAGAREGGVIPKYETEESLQSRYYEIWEQKQESKYETNQTEGGGFYSGYISETGKEETREGEAGEGERGEEKKGDNSIETEGIQTGCDGNITSDSNSVDGATPNSKLSDLINKTFSDVEEKRAMSKSIGQREHDLGHIFVGESGIEAELEAELPTSDLPKSATLVLTNSLSFDDIKSRSPKGKKDPILTKCDGDESLIPFVRYVYSSLPLREWGSLKATKFITDLQRFSVIKVIEGEEETVIKNELHLENGLPLGGDSPQEDKSPK